LSWLQPSDFERRLLEDVSQRWPRILPLARVLAVATRIEPLLLRNARLRFLGDTDTELESLLWFSPLVDARSSREIILHAGTARLLANQLKAEDEPRYAAAWACTRAHTRHWSAEDRLEQDLRYHVLEDDQDRLRQGLRDMLKRIQRETDADRRIQLARWVRQSLPQLIGKGGVSDEARLLAQYASHALGATASWSDLSPPEALPDWLAAKLPEPFKPARLEVELRHEPGRLVLHCLPPEGQANLIAFPTPLPAKLYIQVEGMSGAWHGVAVGSRVALPAVGRRIRLTTIAGQQYELEAVVPADASPALDSPPLFLSHVAEDAELARRVATWLQEQGLAVELLDEDAVECLDNPEAANQDARLLRLWSPAARRHWLEQPQDQETLTPRALLLRVEGTEPPDTGNGAAQLLDLPDWRKLEASFPAAQRLVEQLRTWLVQRGSPDREAQSESTEPVVTGADQGEPESPGTSPQNLAAWLDLEAAMQEGRIVKGLIDGKIKGGLTVMINGIRAILPGSLVDVHPVKDTKPYEGKEAEFKVIKIDRKRENVVVSRKAVLEEIMLAQRESFLANLKEGATVKGIVKNINKYGAFVDLGGIDGLLHITDLAWRWLKHPSEVLAVGDEVTTKVLKFDRKKNRISLGLKQLSDDPWIGLSYRYPAGTRMFGKVTHLNDFGCFVEIEPGVEGLVHVSDMDWTNKNVIPSSIVSPGNELEVMVLEIDEKRRRISLSMKQCKPNPWVKFASDFKKGDKVRGQIKSITDFGIFIALPSGIDGLVHPSDLSWNLAGEDAMRNYRKDQEVEAVVLSINLEMERISLGIKQLDNEFNSTFSTISTGGADIFLSHSQSDATIASQLAQRFREQGWSVFLDMENFVGELMNEIIEDQLQNSRAIVVLWSARSRKSKYVLEEANYGKRKSVLFPAFIEKVEIPYGFGRISTADLVGWSGEKNHPGLVALIGALEQHLRSKPVHDGSIRGGLEVNPRHKVFVSYHHANDQAYRDRFERLFAGRHDIMVSKSVQIGDIQDGLATDTIRRKIRDEYLRDSTVTVVLVGAQTWQRKHVDWEIGSSIRNTEYNPRSGLLGILLPSYPGYATNKYDPYTIPPRLNDNIECGYAMLYKWSDDPTQLQAWIHEAFLRRKDVNPDNSFDNFVKNRSGSRWQP